MFSRTPLAWKNLAADWRRLGLSCAGVAFAAVLMFVENGFRNALLDSPVQWIRMLDCDLIAISRTRSSLPSEQMFPHDLLRRASADPAVVATAPMYIERARAQIRVVDRPRRPIRVIGLTNEPKWLLPRSLRRALSELSPPRTALLDRETRPQYGLANLASLPTGEQAIELAGRSINIVGTVSIGTDFVNEGTLLMSVENFASYFPFRNQGAPLEVVDLGLIQVGQGSDPNQVAQRLTALEPQIWTVLTRQQLIDREIEFWNRQTPVGIIFSIGSMMGFAVGVIICYQILFTSIHDSMPEFATLKAMGYPDRFFIVLVMEQAVYLSLIGFVPALAISYGLFQLLQSLAGLPMLITFPRALLILGLTVSMCLVSAIFSIRKLLRADPANLF